MLEVNGSKVTQGCIAPGICIDASDMQPERACKFDVRKHAFCRVGTI